jgi:periplasmic protein TonB
MYVASTVAVVSVLHAGVFVLLARDPAVRSVPVQRQVMVATLIAPEPAQQVSMVATAATRPKAASHTTRRANAAARSSTGSVSQPAGRDPVRPAACR